MVYGRCMARTNIDLDEEACTAVMRRFHLRTKREVVEKFALRLVAAEPLDLKAAALYRTCRQQGETVRKLLDCLIAPVAIRADIPILHRDGDYEALARHTGLQAA